MRFEIEQPWDDDRLKMSGVFIGCVTKDNADQIMRLQKDNAGKAQDAPFADGEESDPAGKKPEEKAPAAAGPGATAALRAFAQEVLDYFDLSSFSMEGSELQEIAEKHGLLRQEKRHEPCGKECRCEGEVHSDSEWKTGVICYRRTPLLTGEQESTTDAGHDELSRNP